MKLVHNVSRETGEEAIHPPRGGVLRRSRVRHCDPRKRGAQLRMKKLCSVMRSAKVCLEGGYISLAAHSDIFS
jgi:hypothetical protein